MSERTRIFTQLVCEWLIKPDTIPRMKVDASKKCSLRGVGLGCWASLQGRTTQPPHSFALLETRCWTESDTLPETECQYVLDMETVLRGEHSEGALAPLSVLWVWCLSSGVPYTHTSLEADGLQKTETKICLPHTRRERAHTPLCVSLSPSGNSEGIAESGLPELLKEGRVSVGGALLWVPPHAPLVHTSLRMQR